MSEMEVVESGLDVSISLTTKEIVGEALIEEDGSVPAEAGPERCEATVSYHSEVRCEKAKGHPYGHKSQVADTTYSWGDTGRWNEPGGQR